MDIITLMMTKYEKIKINGKERYKTKHGGTEAEKLGVG